jgi:hypothetical protein
VSSTYKLILSGVCFLLGLGYLYRPDLIYRMNTLIRETVLNDAYIALERKKWGAFFLLISFLFLYMGLTAIGWKP